MVTGRLAAMKQISCKANSQNSVSSCDAEAGDVAPKPLVVLFCLLLTIPTLISNKGQRATLDSTRDENAIGILCGTEFYRDDWAQQEDFLDVEVRWDGQIPIVFHVVRDDSGGGGYSPGENLETASELKWLVDYLNSLFPEPPVDEDYDGPQFRKFEFYIDRIIDGRNESSLRNTEYLEITDGEAKEIRRRHRILGRINIFLVERILRNGRATAGLASFPGADVQGIILDWGYLTEGGEPTSILAHEIAHYFFVHHTHEEDIFGKELVTRDPANCENRGDKLCDTPADPGSGFRAINSDSCAYTGGERDPAGVPYDPDPYNIVSNAVPLRCAKRFTYGQLERMTRALDRGIVGQAKPSLPPKIRIFVYPNPFGDTNSTATIEFDTPPGFSTGTLSVFDVKGRLVRRLFAGFVEGIDLRMRASWDGRNASGKPVASGISFARVLLLRSNGERSEGVGKVVIIR